MIKTLYEKFQHWSEKGSVFILSDTHFNDFDCKLMDENWISAEEQIKIINSYVKKNDTLILLGDVGDIECIRKLNGYKVLITGNHDVGADNYKRVVTTWALPFESFPKAKDVQKHYQNNNPNLKYRVRSGADLEKENFLYWEIECDNCLFDEVYTGPLMISEKILLSHEPIDGLTWCINIHGHDHSNMEHYTLGCKHLNLAANVCNYTPINLGAEIKKGLLSDIVSIHRQTIDKQIKRGKK